MMQFLTGGGNVGIGTAAPSGKLHINAASNAIVIKDGALNEGIILDKNYLRSGWTGTDLSVAGSNNLYLQTYSGGWFNRLTILNNGNVGIGTVTPGSILQVVQSANVVASFNRTTTDGAILNFQQDGIAEGSISVTGITVSYNAFTGSHFAMTKEKIERGMLVSMTGENEHYHGNAESEFLYGVIKSTYANDPKIMGSYLGVLEPALPASLENPHQIMAVGNGEIWVVDEGEDLLPGDYLISSSTAGHAMKEKGDYEIAYIVARVAEPVDWESVSEMQNGKKHKKVSVFFESFSKNNKAEKLQVEIEKLKLDNSMLKSEMKEVKEYLDLKTKK